MLEEITADTESAGRTVRASMDDPQYRRAQREERRRGRPQTLRAEEEMSDDDRDAVRRANWGHDPYKR